MKPIKRLIAFALILVFLLPGPLCQEWSEGGHHLIAAVAFSLLGALLPFDSGENGINPNAGILKISKQISDRHPITMNVIIQKEPYNAF